jgi:two-component system chemotaxis response regulator CheY
MTYKFDNLSVLVVDDMIPIQTLITSFFKTIGVKDVYKADNGQEGLRVFYDKKPDLIITDWLMDEMDGLEMTKRIRTDPSSPNPFVPIIMITGYSAKFRVFEARDIGITEFLTKPFSAHDFYARVQQVIEKSRPFIESNEFFGPDRRRRHKVDFNGVHKREEDQELQDRIEISNQKAGFIFDDLKSKISKIIQETEI